MDIWSGEYTVLRRGDRRTEHHNDGGSGGSSAGFQSPALGDSSQADADILQQACETGILKETALRHVQSCARWKSEYKFS
jgi:hypothetical protein